MRSHKIWVDRIAEDEVRVVHQASGGALLFLGLAYIFHGLSRGVFATSPFDRPALISARSAKTQGCGGALSVFEREVDGQLTMRRPVRNLRCLLEPGHAPPHMFYSACAFVPLGWNQSRSGSAIMRAMWTTTEEWEPMEEGP